MRDTPLMTSRGTMLLLGLITAPVAVSAQDVAQIRERIQRLEMRAAELNAKADSSAAAERQRWAGTLDSMRIGTLLLLVPHPLRDDARRAGALAWSVLQHVFGDSVALMLRDRPFLVISDAVMDSAHMDIRWHDALGTPVLSPAGNRVRGLAMNIITSIYQQFWQRLDPAMRNWLGAPLMPNLDPGLMPGAVYVELVTSNSPVARECFRGTLTACGEAHGLTRPADPATAWYGPDGRRELVQRRAQVLRVGVDKERFSRCTEKRSDADCVRLLRENTSLVPPPLSGVIRGTLLTTALHLGGDGSLSRLLATPDDPIADRLSDAAGASPEGLLSVWRSAVISAKPRATQLRPTVAWTSIVWMAGLLTLALRSSRWR